MVGSAKRHQNCQSPAIRQIYGKINRINTSPDSTFIEKTRLRLAWTAKKTATIPYVADTPSNAIEL